MAEYVRVFVYKGYGIYTKAVAKPGEMGYTVEGFDRVFSTVGEATEWIDEGKEDIKKVIPG